jgi:acetyl esterase/lipase
LVYNNRNLILPNVIMSNSRMKHWGVVVGLCVVVWATVGQASSLSPSTRPVGVAVRPWIPQGFHVVRDVPYVLHGRRSQMLDVYVPDVASLPRPVMVWIHGGGWSSGDKSAPPGLGLLSRGYIVASINYRLSNEALFPAQIFDCKAAIRFLRANAREFDIDPSRIGVWGDSAGGQLASLLGITNGRAEYEGSEGNPGVSSEVQAVCDWFGPSDFLQTSDVRAASARAVKLLFGGQVSAHAATAIFASPAEQVGHAPVVPFLIMHGEVDPLVPVHQSQILFEKLKEAGASVKLVIVPKGGHGNGWFRNRGDMLMVYDFFDRCFRKAQARAASVTTRPST